jgi:hypothetical protein
MLWAKLVKSAVLNAHTIYNLNMLGTDFPLTRVGMFRPVQMGIGLRRFLRLL